jgi:hypothetical protein
MEVTKYTRKNLTLQGDLWTTYTKLFQINKQFAIANNNQDWKSSDVRHHATQMGSDMGRTKLSGKDLVAVWMLSGEPGRIWSGSEGPDRLIPT